MFRRRVEVVVGTRRCQLEKVGMLEILRGLNLSSLHWEWPIRFWQDCWKPLEIHLKFLSKTTSTTIVSHIFLLSLSTTRSEDFLFLDPFQLMSQTSCNSLQSQHNEALCSLHYRGKWQWLEAWDWIGSYPGTIDVAKKSTSCGEIQSGIESGAEANRLPWKLLNFIDFWFCFVYSIVKSLFEHHLGGPSL